MASEAFAAYGTEVRVSDGVPLSALTINAATNATPIVVTTSTNHGVTDFSYGTITGVVGTTSANGTWILERVSNTQLRLRGSVGNGAYVSGGSLVIAGTFATIAELRNPNDAGMQTTTVDVSAHDGDGWSSEIVVTKSTQAMRLDVNLVGDDPTHDPDTGLLSLFQSGAKRHFLLVLPQPPTGFKPVCALFGFVNAYETGFVVNQALQATFTVEFDGGMNWQPV